MTSPRSSPATRLLVWLAESIYRHRVWWTWPHLAVAAFCIFVTVVKPQLQFNTDRSALVGERKEYHHIFLEFKKEFPIEDDIVVVVESEQMEKNRQFVERLGAKLEAETNLFTQVFYKGDLKMMGRKALLFVPEPELVELEKTLRDFRPFLQQFTKATNLVSLFNLVNTQFGHARKEENEENRSLIKALPALERIVDQATDGLLRSGIPPSPGINALFDGGQQAERDLYITFGDGRIYLATAQAVSGDKRSEAVDR